MNKKSKLLTFILSIIPGLGQVYLNYTVRGLIFLFAVAGTILASFIIHELFYAGQILLIFLPFIWLVAMVDSMILVDRINKYGVEDKYEQNQSVHIELEKQNRKIIAMMLSIIPGAGHMYLELQKQGIQLMTMFFFVIFIIDFLQLSFLMFALPIIWFFGVFDTLKKVSSQEPLVDEDILLLSWINVERSRSISRDRVIGYGLIGIGVILIFNRIAVPFIQEFIHWRVSQYLRTGLTALLFIIGGVKMLAGNKEEESEENNGGANLCDSGE
ncbi:hypothetical protein [Candidatus Contubernalis alkaliaceticus]|uniref:hypothetical protein n=1 Tax=Candidatus Contubernalis alkaliaceticus TaxID=338645 RepID=UPI001F4BF130|nr:hypothetical protein [Candidatus Contubernalis alkalaceticus]UNC93044.1 hypothetical protein HUE98_13655 [Candidatus Contubernalis alkalaceticus]